jgi:hypothetical protein
MDANILRPVMRQPSSVRLIMVSSQRSPMIAVEVASE